MKHIMLINREKLLKQHIESKVLQKFGLQGPDDLTLIQNFNHKAKRDFEETIVKLGRLSPKIKLMVEL